MSKQNMSNNPYLITMIAVVSSILFLAFTVDIDLSGEWTYNEGESDLGDTQFQFAWETIEITQSDEEISIQRSGQGQGGTIELSETVNLSGEESENTWFGNNARVSTASWSEDGTELIIESEAEFAAQGQTNTINTTETYSLDESGDILTIINETSSSFGNYTQTLIYNRD